MASIVSAGTTSSTALNMSADTSGVLQLASNNGSVGLTIDTSQNVLVGMSSYGVTNAGASISPTASSSFYVAGGAALTIGRGVSDGTAVQFNRSGTNIGTIGVSTTGLTMTGTNGISFTATQSASSDANTLDDYEEGTWTPTISAVSGSITSYTSYGTYTKIGNTVSIQARITLTNIGTASGGTNIGGLPFNLLTTATGQQITFFCREGAVSGLAFQAFISSGGSSGNIQNMSGNNPTWTNSYQYVYSGIYQTA